MPSAYCRNYVAQANAVIIHIIFDKINIIQLNLNLLTQKTIIFYPNFNYKWTQTQQKITFLKKWNAPLERPVQVILILNVPKFPEKLEVTL